MNTINIEVCERYYEEFKQFGVPDIFQETRQRPVVEYRQLFHTILRKKYKLTYQAIADYTEYKGRHCHHAAVINGINRTLDTNYYAFDYIGEVYDAYFDDKKEERMAKLMAKERKVSFSKHNKLSELIRDVPTEKLDEVYNMVLLRVKSWSWKSNDKCLTVTGSH